MGIEGFFSVRMGINFSMQTFFRLADEGAPQTQRQWRIQQPALKTEQSTGTKERLWAHLCSCFPFSFFLLLLLAHFIQALSSESFCLMTKRLIEVHDPVTPNSAQSRGLICCYLNLNITGTESKRDSKKLCRRYNRTW